MDFDELLNFISEERDSAMTNPPSDSYDVYFRRGILFGLSRIEDKVKEMEESSRGYGEDW